MKKYCTYNPTFPQTLTHLLFFLLLFLIIVVVVFVINLILWTQSHLSPVVRWEGKEGTRKQLCCVCCCFCSKNWC